MANDAYTTAKISVWWDLVHCQVPRDSDPHSVAQNITFALRNTNFHGPLSISAYFDATRLPLRIQHALSSTGISLHNVPDGVNDAIDKQILVDMLLWAVDNPAPANYLIISGYRYFSYALDQLRIRRYNILLAQPLLRASVSLNGAAKIVWFWPILSSGGPPHYINDPLIGNHQNPKPKSPLKVAYQPKPSKSDNDNDDIPIPIPNNNDENSSINNQCGDDGNLNSSEPEALVKGVIDVILGALSTLKAERVFPAEGNITDCILYGDFKYRSIDVRKSLDFAIEKRRAVQRSLGALHLYVGTNEEIWRCVNYLVVL